MPTLGDTKVPGPVIEPCKDESSGQTAEQLRARLNPKLLGEYNVAFDAKIWNENPKLPDNVAHLTGTLLDFQGIIPLERKARRHFVTQMRKSIDNQ